MDVVRRYGLAIVTTALVVSGCSNAVGSMSKAGPEGAPVTLRVATNDLATEPAGAMIAAFSAKAHELSGGSITVTPAFGAAGAGPDYDQRTARLVESGSMEMGLIPSRTWDTEGVTTLRALNTPFLITSDALTRMVVQSDVATTVMSGLDSAGVTGLALFPESMRHPFSFSTPLKSPESFAGKKIRTPTSKTVAAMYGLLGATVDDGTISPQAQDGFEIAYVEAPPATATGNVTFFPKVNVLVVNSKVLAGLSEEQRQALSQAAIAARDEVLAQQSSDAEQATEYCAKGGAVVLANQAELTALAKAVQPLVDKLSSDPATQSAIEAIRHLKATSPEAPAVRPCGTPSDHKASTAPSPEDTIDPGTLNGIYRVEISDEDIKAVGWDFPDLITENHGMWTWTLKDGSVCYDVKAVDAYTPKLCGTYMVTQDLVYFAYDDKTVESFTWSEAANGDLTMHTQLWLDPMSDALSLHPWVRIGDAS